MSALTTMSFAQEEKENDIDTRMLAYHKVDGKEVRGYLAQPTGEGTFPAIILIHEWWGLNESIKAYADAFAQEGYVALAVDLYNGKVATKVGKAMKLSRTVRKNEDVAFANLQAALDYLKQQSNVDKEKLASVGWCFGGGWAYRVAKNDLGVKASIIYYGRFVPDDDFENMKALILGHFAEKDRIISVNDVKEFEANLKIANKEHSIFIYPNMKHGFAKDLFTAKPTNEESKVAWERTLAFLEKHLE